jgi:hypothetical protein
MGNPAYFRLDSGGTAIDAAHPLPMAAAPLPTDSTGAQATSVKASSGNVANASGVATLAAVTAKTSYITGFDVTGSGAIAASVVSVTVAGLLGGTATYTLAVAAGATLGNQPLIARFDPPLPASAANTAIVVTCPALGAGNTNNTVNAYGYYI